jgi:2-dehydro-3-deoxyphosphogluconate aldolase/(4S)-4-hydroxy-2-oxoglutarate aldolase
MGKGAALKRIAHEGIIPVVRAASADEALKAVDALRAGGISVLEITMTVPGAVDVIRRVVALHPDALVGAGTVLDAAAAQACLEAGARFIVSPVLVPDAVRLCSGADAAAIPGALTPTEIHTAWKAGADAVKVFPASAMGGPSYIRTLRTLMPAIRLIPTGGVTLATAAEYIRAGAFAIGAGTDLVDLAAIRAGEPRRVAEAAKAFREAVAAARARPGERG